MVLKTKILLDDSAEDEACKPTFFLSIDGVWGDDLAYMELLAELYL